MVSTWFLSLKARKYEVEGSLEPTITVKQADKKGMEFEGVEAIAWAKKSVLIGLAFNAVLRPGGLRYEGEPG